MAERSTTLSRLGAALAVLAIVGCSKANAKDDEVATATDNLGSSEAGLVISQVYGGAGMPGAAWTRDYVELFNRSAAPIALARVSIRFAGGAGELVPIAKLPENVSVPAGGYYLVGFGGGIDGADLKVDLGGANANILPGSGRVVLVREGAKAPLDVVGYGDVRESDSEGDAPARSTARTEALVRKGAGCTDTDTNASDFEPAKATPRSSKSPLHLCGAK